MKIETRVFGTIDIDEDKIITFKDGIIGFPGLNRFALVHNESRGADVSIRWLQSLDELAFALPVINPLDIKPDYNPVVEDEYIKALGDSGEDALAAFVTVSVPGDIEKISANLSAPIVINMETRHACQVIVENAEYPIKYYFYELIKSRKAGE